MPLVLDNPEVLDVTISSYEINSFSLDLGRYEIHAAYDKFDAQNQSRGESVVTIDGPSFAEAIGTANSYGADAVMEAIANQGIVLTEEQATAIRSSVDVYTPIKKSLYDAISASSGKAGAIS